MNEQRLSTGTIIDDSIKIEGFIGEGGMGTVYKASQPSLNRIIALKILPLLHLKSDDSRERFKREANALSLLSHKNIVAFYSYGLWQQNVPYIAMEYLNGVGLDKILQQSEIIPVDRLLKFLIQITEGLAYAHNHGIIHRDLKPANILVTKEPEEDTIKLLDFGLARFLPKKAEESQKLTATGLLIGSVNYMSPEQCSGTKVDQRSDIYALGCIIYQMLSSKPPFDGNNPLAIVYKHTHEEAAAIPESIISLDKRYKALQAICKNCMNKIPEQRYQNAETLLVDLLKISHEGEVLDLTVRKKTSKLVLAGIVLSVSTLAFIIFVYMSDTIFPSLEAQYISRFGDARSWKFALIQAQVLEKRGKRKAALDLFKTSLLMAKKYKETPMAQASIQMQIASNLEELGMKAASQEYAEQALTSYIDASKSAEWTSLKNKGFSSALSSLLELLLKLHSKNRRILSESDVLLSLLLEKQEYQTAVLLAKEQLLVAQLSASSSNDGHERFLTMQRRLAECYLKANMNSEASDLLKANLAKCKQWKDPLQMAECLHLYATLLTQIKNNNVSANIFPLQVDTEQILDENHGSLTESHKVMTLQSLARLYYQLGNTNEAVRCLARVHLNLATIQKSDPARIWDIYLQQAKSYDVLGINKKTVENLTKAADAIFSEPQETMISDIKYLLDQITSLGGSKSKGLKEDLPFVIEHISDRAETMGIITEFNPRISVAYDAIGNYEKALEYEDRNIAAVSKGKWKLHELVSVRERRVQLLFKMKRTKEAAQDLSAIMQLAKPEFLITVDDYEQISRIIWLECLCLTIEGKSEEGLELVNNFIVPPKLCTEHLRGMLDNSRALCLAGSGKSDDCQKLMQDLAKREVIKDSIMYQFFLLLTDMQVQINQKNFSKAEQLLKLAHSKYSSCCEHHLSMLFLTKSRA